MQNIWRALSIDKEVYGADHTEAAADLYDVMGILAVRLILCLSWEMPNLQGRYADAKSLFERALSIDEEVYGAHHPEVAADRHKLAGMLEVQVRMTYMPFSWWGFLI